MVQVSGEELDAVTELLKRTIPDATDVSVQRNQHDLLYAQYIAKRDNVDALAGFRQERWLWNGGASWEDNLKAGFKIEYANMTFNKYGVGIYFAADARLAAYHEEDTRRCNRDQGEKHLILARVALGRMAEREPMRGSSGALLRTTTPRKRMINPDLTEAERKLPPQDADSATDAQSNKIAIVYDNNQAFPQYLVTYKSNPMKIRWNHNSMEIHPYVGVLDGGPQRDICQIVSAPTTTDTIERGDSVIYFGLATCEAPPNWQVDWAMWSAWQKNLDRANNQPFWTNTMTGNKTWQDPSQT